MGSQIQGSGVPGFKSLGFHCLEFKHYGFQPITVSCFLSLLLNPEASRARNG